MKTPNEVKPRVSLKDIPIELKGNIFRALATNTFIKVGIEFGLDKKYASTSGIQSGVRYIYNEVRANPEKFSVHPDTVALVAAAVTKRNSINNTNANSSRPSVFEQNKAIAERPISDLVLDGRNTAMKLLNAKMARISSSRKKLDAVSVGELAKVAGIMFDKGQIIQGQATENVAIMAKISDNMSPEEALNAVLKMREVNAETKFKKD